MRFSEDRIEKLTCSDGIQREIHIWEPDKPRAVFLFVHGGMDHGGNYKIPALYFRERGIATCAHDQHGHDKKRRAHIPHFGVFLEDLDLMLDWVKEHFPGIPIFIMSHSMGGLVTTLWGVLNFKGDPLVKGFISSAPYYVNAVKAPKIIESLAGVLSALFPRAKVPIEDLLEVATHDQEVYKQYRQEQKEGIMAEEASFRFGAEMLKAQAKIPGLISQWEHPILVIMAGEDRYVDAEATRALLGQIDPELLTELYYPQNYHENFKELNREEIFEKIMEWVEPRLS
jgi:alpha-beta hydrolase superfamily lysophospholipase